MTARTPTLADVVRRALDTRLADLRVSMPGRIEKFDPGTQMADVKPLLKETFENEQGDQTVASLPVIPNVPVQFAGGGGFASTFPVAVGDECLLVFADRSLDLWQARGGEQDPLDLRRHDLTDCVAIMGARSNPNRLTEFDSARAVFGNKGPRVAADGAVLHLGVGHGESATESVVRGTTYRAAEDVFFNGMVAQLTAAGAALASAAPLNAIPIVGGIMALPGLTAAATALSAIAAVLSTFSGAAPGFLSTTTKVK